MKLYLTIILVCLHAMICLGAPVTTGIPVSSLPTTNQSPDSAWIISSQQGIGKLTNDTFKIAASNLFQPRLAQFVRLTNFNQTHFDIDPVATETNVILQKQYIINVKMYPYNAVGDGIANDTTAIQSAINAAHTDGESVFIPPGRYRVVFPLTLHPRMRIHGSTPEQGNLLAYTNTTIVVAHAGNGFVLDGAYTEGAGVELSNMRIFRDPTTPSGSTVALVNFSNIKGGVLENLYLFQYGVDSKGILLSNSFFNSIRGFKCYAEDVDARCISIEYPCTVNQITEGMVQSGAGVGIYCESQDNTFNTVNFEFCATGFQEGLTAFGNCAGTLFLNCHFEANTVANVDARGMSEVGMTFIQPHFVMNGGGVNFLTTDNRDIQNFIIIGRHDEFNAGTTYHMAKLGIFDVSTSPHAAGAQIYFDAVTSDPTSYIEGNWWKNNTNTGIYTMTFSHPTATNFLQFLSSDYGSMVWNHPAYGDTLKFESTYGGRMRLGMYTNLPRFGVGGDPISEISGIGSNAIVSLQGVSTNSIVGNRFYNSGGGTAGLLLQDLWLGDIFLGTGNKTNALKMAYDGSITLTDPLTLDHRLILANSTGIYSKVFGSSATIPVFWLDTNNAVLIAPAGDATIIGGALSVSNTVTALTGATIEQNLLVNGTTTIRLDGATLTVAPELGTNATLITFGDPVMASIGRASNGGTNFSINVNDGGLNIGITTSPFTITNANLVTPLFKVGLVSGWSGTGLKGFTDDSTFKTLPVLFAGPNIIITTNGANLTIDTTNIMEFDELRVGTIISTNNLTSGTATNSNEVVTLAQLQESVSANTVLFFDTHTASSAGGFSLSGTVKATNYSSTVLPAQWTNAAVTSANGNYIAAFISTNITTRIASGLGEVEIYCFENSAGSGEVTAQFYLINAVTMAEEYEFTPAPSYQTVPSGTTPTKLTFSVPITDYISTTNLHVMVKIKVQESGADPTIRIVSGGAFTSHASFTLPSSYFLTANNPTATGTLTVPNANITTSLSIAGIPGWTGLLTNIMSGIVTQRLSYASGVLTNVATVSW